MSGLFLQIGVILLWAIPILGISHATVLFGLRLERRKKLSFLANQLKESTSDFPIRTSVYSELRDGTPDQILAFCEDILAQLSRGLDGRQLKGLQKLQENKPYRKLRTIQSIYAVGPAVTEAYPMLGILGTVISIAGSLSTLSVGDGTVGPDFSVVIESFGTALWTTIEGLVFAVIFMIIHSWVDSNYTILSDVRRKFEEIVREARFRDDMGTRPGGSAS